MPKIKNIMCSQVPVVILCGGRGMRISPLNPDIPKPLIKIGDKPILWHVMKIYASWGFKRFILCLGYKGAKIRQYFKKNDKDAWQVECVDTGADTLKSQRLAKIKRLVKEKTFLLAYGDDVADIDLGRLLRLHLRCGSIATVTAVRVVSDFGVMEIDKRHRITKFKEKPRMQVWINGGFMAMDRRIFDYLEYGELEKEIFARLAKQRKICAYKHHGKWKAMNTLKDYFELNSIWNAGRAFWDARQRKSG